MARKASQTAGLIKVRCPNPACKKILAVQAAMGGKKARCPLCGQTMAIPKVAAPAAKRAAKPDAKPAPEPAPKEKPGPAAAPEKSEESAAPPDAPPTEEAPPPEPEKPETEAPEEGAAPPRKSPQDEVFFGGSSPGAAAKEEQKKTPKEEPQEEPAEPEKPKAEEPTPPPEPEPEPSPEGPGPVLPPTRPGAEPVMVGAPSPKGHPTPRTLKRVAKEAAETGYELLGGRLRVVGAIGYDLNTGFRDKCDQLLASGEENLLVDLSQVLYLSSSHIGVIARLATDAMGQGKKVALRVTGKVARVLKFAGIHRLVDIEDVDA